MSNCQMSIAKFPIAKCPIAERPIAKCLIAQLQGSHKRSLIFKEFYDEYYIQLSNSS